MTGDFSTLLPAGNGARGGLVLDAVPTAPASCGLAITVPASASTSRTSPVTTPKAQV
ncbi:MAG: hypothetical protein BMS9Abin20_0414 [Acidimicrobiia bacterium]|nr:MAG: hypothetical protein BMS9Abin20_0414 [Acidimicrobiia bacterium]